MDDLAKRVNIRGTLKKFFLDAFYITAKKSVYFDKGFLLPDSSSTEWFSILFRDFSRTGLANLSLDIICATRFDPEGDRLSALADICFAAMTDETMPDAKRRITLYDVSQTPWLQIGTLLVQDVRDSEEMTAEDKTKYLVLSCQLKWVTQT